MIKLGGRRIAASRPVRGPAWTGWGCRLRRACGQQKTLPTLIHNLPTPARNKPPRRTTMPSGPHALRLRNPRLKKFTPKTNHYNPGLLTKFSPTRKTTSSRSVDRHQPERWPGIRRNRGPASRRNHGPASAECAVAHLDQATVDIDTAGQVAFGIVGKARHAALGVDGAGELAGVFGQHWRGVWSILCLGGPWNGGLRGDVLGWLASRRINSL